MHRRAVCAATRHQHRIFGYPGDGINGLMGALDRARKQHLGIESTCSTACTTSSSNVPRTDDRIAGMAD
jgi:hypothetical protein